ncbi:hypothetical protein BDN71DRAFT_1480167 [Pleurotus eryngii]|uniref:DUF3074 domain-containing protein n=1 Tax=Pleurotus eryngii TaxID=5323 RepID=A0A9P6AAW1_PLEER|nr:hypothetical protein BDN71DRAFT_1480167 [Pleurotus eryngii]
MSEQANFALTITPLNLGSIPPEDEILQAAQKILDSVQSWHVGKTIRGVKTFSRPKQAGDSASWHARRSEHTAEEATFDDLWSKLAVNKAENEKEYIPEIKKVTLVKQISPTQSVWTLYYTFTPPVSPRVFTVLQVVHLEETSPRSGTIVSIPVDVTSDKELAKLEEKGVRGRYTSAERIRELEDGKTEWLMATSSTPGGSIPTFIVERSMASSIVQDVPHFLKWFHSLHKVTEGASN